MKINVLYNNKLDIIEGFQNYDFHADGTDSRIKVNSYTNLERNIDKAECDLIILNDIIRYHNAEAIIRYYADFVGYQGKLVLKFYELDECVRWYNEGRLPPEDFQKIIYGAGEVCNTPRVEDVLNQLKSLNFKIVNVKFDNITAFITAEKQ